MESQQSETWSLVGSVIAFLLALYGIFTQPRVLESTRPNIEQHASEGAIAGQPAPVRLWDDPQAAYSQNKIPLQPPKLPTSPDSSLILLIETNTYDYDETREDRLRTRYAIELCLFGHGFAATSPDRIGSLLVTDSELPPRNSFPQGAKAKCKPFEWTLAVQDFRNINEGKTQHQSSSAFENVIVVWIPEEMIQWHSRNDIAQAIRTRIFQTHNSQVNQETAFLGPLDSENLLSMVNDPVVPGTQPSKQITNADPFIIVSSRATIAPSKLSPNANNDGFDDQIPRCAEILKTSEGQIFRVPPFDDDLCFHLVRAISSQGAFPKLNSGKFLKPKIKVTVFVEWDTYYGRTLFDSFKEAVTKLNKKNQLDIDLIPYLRGLDGAATLYRKKYYSDNNENGGQKATSALIEAAEGPGQFDYIRRLTQPIMGVQLPFLGGTNRPDAIVIFGSDVYDKLALLEFLGQGIPNCTYFTTDMDALFWHPHFLQYTRNLTVAAAFPLEMYWESNNIYRHSPKVEFRDSYQSSLYFAVSSLLTSTPDKLEGVLCAQGHPRLFRIGNEKPIPIVLPEYSAIESSVIPHYDTLLQGKSLSGSIIAQLLVIGIGFLALFFDIPKRLVFSSEVDDEVWDTACNLVNSNCRSRLRLLHTTIKKKWEESRNFARNSKQILPRFASRDISYTDEIGAIRLLDFYEQQVGTIKSRSEVVQVAFNLLSDLFNGKPRTSLSTESETEIDAFRNYYAHGFGPGNSLLLTPSDKSLSLKLRFEQICPSVIFAIIAGISLFLLILIFAQPFPHFFGPEDHFAGERSFRWFLGVLLLLVLYSVIYRVCLEQWRFRNLIRDLRRLLKFKTGFSNRQILLLIADQSKSICALVIVPGAMIFIAFVAHMRVLGGVPLTGEVLSILVGGLLVLAYSYILLWKSADEARKVAIQEYNNDILIARRCHSRLSSFIGKEKEPIQDDAEILTRDLGELLRKASVIAPADDKEGMNIDDPTFRREMCDYLVSLIDRYKTTIEQLGELKSGVMAPLQLSPIMAAVLVPVAGTGGLNLIQWLVTMAR